MHLKSCSRCRAKREQWAKLWSLMDGWEEEKPSYEVENSLLSEIRAALQSEAARTRRISWRNIAETLVPLVAATAVAFLGVALAVKKVGPALEPLSPLALLTCGVVWMAVYGLMFSVSFEKLGGMYRIQGVQPSIYARYALAALGIWLLFTGLMEFGGIGKLAAAAFWPRFGTTWYFLLGVAYSFIPLASASVFMRGKNLNRASAHGVLLGLFFLFLLAPEIFLYCSSFSLGIAFNWTVGTIVGCVTGGPAGVWLGRKAVDGLKA